MNLPELAELSILNDSDDSTRQNRVDLITQASHSGYKHLIKLIVDDEVCGKIVAYVIVIEWQKCDLPHYHMIVWIAWGDRQVIAEQIDDVVQARIVDPKKILKLYKLTTEMMMQKPFIRARRLENNRCTKIP